jgi:DNA primase large subunit
MKRITKTGEVAVASEVGRSSIGGLVSTPDDTIPEEYPLRLNTYTIPPNYDITVEKFEEYAFSRLQLLRAVENAAMKFQREDELSKAIKTAEDKWMPLHSNESAATYSLLEERRRDQAAHFILRLAFCSTADSIRWFVTQECLLFRIRFHLEMSRERSDFLKRTNSHLIPVDPSEKMAVLEHIRKCSPGKEMDDFFKVPFEFVPDLVGRRGVYLHKGYAYVPKCDSFSIVMTKFKENLEFWMERTARELPSLRDDRLLPLLRLVKTSDSSSTDVSRGFVEGKLTSADLDAVPMTTHTNSYLGQHPFPTLHATALSTRPARQSS